MKTTLIVTIALSLLLELETRAENENYDVVIYGATPGGLAAALSLARADSECMVALTTRYKRVGGMITNGLTHPDFRTFEARTGLFREFNKRVEGHYRDRYGADSQQVKDSLSGTHAGPEVNHTVFTRMLDEHENISILTEHRLHSVKISERRIQSVTLKQANDGERTLSAKYFVDATYEGDLMAAAKISFRVGREGREEYGEALAPENADDQLQGYNFRLTMTDREGNSALVPKPVDYVRGDYLELLPLLKDGSVKRIFGDPYRGLRGGIYKRQTPILPNGKRDINDVSHSIVRLSLPNINGDWPDGDEATRQRLFSEHLRHNVGMLYFLQHDPDVPRKFQKEARQWGLCKDEFVDNHHLPEQLYVREARRMVGHYVFSQADTEAGSGPNRARAKFHSDAIAMGDYGPNCHGTFHEGPRFGGRHTGEFYQKAAPYQIPYGVILPNEIDNLVVPVACSSSHVGFCALRLEPIWMSLGQAAGEAVHLALQENRSLPEVAPSAIRQRLHATRCATVYTADVPEESSDFQAVQWWGSQGGFHLIEGEPAHYGERGEQVIGQYHEAFPHHAVGLDELVDATLKERWLALALRVTSADPADLEKAKTRRDFIQTCWSNALFPSGQEARRLTLATNEAVDFLLYKPERLKEAGPLPLLLFLHGGGESGDDLEQVKKHGPPMEIEEGRTFPMIVVSPLNPDKKGFWDEDRLARFLDALPNEITFDSERVYLAGMSRGGYGAYRLAMENPNRFAALLVICGAAPAPYARWLHDLPVWIIHGEKDISIPVTESKRMAEALKAVGGNVKLTLHPDAGHDVWTETFQDSATIRWLLRHSQHQ